MPSHRQDECGKSLFVLHFARFLGMSHIKVTSLDPMGNRQVQAYAVDVAVRDLSGTVPHQTRRLQSVTWNCRREGLKDLSW